MLKPNNLLILDEPTNDLDVETLELLEDILGNYKGTLILVSHDREFVDNVVTSSLFFEGEGKIKEFVGGYADIYQWYAANAVSKQANKAKTETSRQSESPKTKPQSKQSKKLSYKQQLELEKLPVSIDKLENEVAQIQSQISDGDFFKQDSDSTSKTLAQLADAESRLSEAYARWDELEALTE